jgi:hypothetical protein
LTCGWLYADCMQSNNPGHSAECMCREPDRVWAGDCPHWRDAEKFSWLDAPELQSYVDSYVQGIRYDIEDC